MNKLIISCPASSFSQLIMNWTHSTLGTWKEDLVFDRSKPLKIIKMQIELKLNSKCIAHAKIGCMVDCLLRLRSVLTRMFLLQCFLSFFLNKRGFRLLKLNPLLHEFCFPLIFEIYPKTGSIIVYRLVDSALIGFLF